jgi:predicted Abi (CAAX) family protease
MGVQKAFARIAAAATLPPSWQQVFVAGAAFTGLAVVTVPFNTLTGFAQWSPEHKKTRAVINTLRTILIPSLGEEVFWRAALLPHPAVDGPAAVVSSAVWPIALVQLVCYTLYHILEGYALARVFPRLRQGAAATFTDRRFMFICFLLGATCTWGYIASAGSLWVATFLHWLPVWIWIVLLGGEQKLRGDTVARVEQESSSLADSEESSSLTDSEEGSQEGTP